MSETESDFSAKVSGFGDSSDLESEGAGPGTDREEPNSRASGEEGGERGVEEAGSESDGTESLFSGGYRI